MSPMHELGFGLLGVVVGALGTLIGDGRLILRGLALALASVGLRLLFSHQ